MLYTVLIWVTLIGDPFRGSRVVCLFGLAQGLTLMADTLAIRFRGSEAMGLLGSQRSEYFYSLSGIAQIALCIFLAGGLLR